MDPVKAPVSAEQAAAETYRQLITSGKFFLEYGPKADFKDKKFRDIADGIEQYHEYKQIAYNGELKFVYVNEKNFSKKKRSYTPKIFYKDGKCYQFQNKFKAMLYENSSSNSELNLPAFFSALLPNNSNISSVLGTFNANEVSTLIESGTENIFGQNFNYDKYNVKFLDSNGNDINQNPNVNLSSTYTFYYNENGELKFVKREGLDSQMTAYDAEVKIYIGIEKFTGDIPTGFFNFPKGCKVYRKSAGTLDDLLGNEELVEKY